MNRRPNTFTAAQTRKMERAARTAAQRTGKTHGRCSRFGATASTGIKWAPTVCYLIDQSDEASISYEVHIPAERRYMTFVTER